MMRKIISTAMLCCALTAFSQNESVTVGFCNGELATRSSIELNGKGWTEAAIKLSAGSLSAYEGANITAVRAALVNRVNVDTLRVWVRDDLNGQNLSEGTITRQSDPAVVKGWNEVSLDSPLKIEGDKPLYVGYSLHQKANVQALSIVGEGVLDTSFYRFNDGDWNDVSDKGVLSIEAILSGSAIADYDLGIVNAQVYPYPSLAANAVMVKATVANYGLQAVSGWTFECAAGDAKGSYHMEKDLQPNSFVNVSFAVDPGVAVVQDAVWTVSIVGIDGHDDGKAGNNSVEAFCTYRKNVLVEEFTTEKCSNCPAMAAKLSSMLDARKDVADVINVVCHHSGFYTDSFTMPCDEDFLWFYNNGSSTYAPAIMVDRSNDYSGDTKTPVFLPVSADALGEEVDKALERTANCSVSLAFEYDEVTGKLDVTAGCVKNDKFSAEKPMITLYLTEDKVNAVYQQGSTGVYTHSHLIRDYSSSWGEPVVWDGNSYSFKWETTIDSAWKFKDLKLVGVLSNYNDADVNDCSVMNSASLSLVDDQPVSGVSGISSEVKSVVAIYDISGCKIATLPASGICIIRYSDGSTRKVVR